MIKGLFKYELRNYLYSGKELAPIVLFIAWLAFNYTIAPVDLMKSFGLSSLVIFLILLLMGIGYANNSNLMIEQSIFVKLENKNNIYIAKLLVLVTLSFSLTLLGILVPMLLYITNSFSLFTRRPVLSDFPAIFLLLFIAALSGGIMSQYFQSRFIKNTRLSIFFSMLIGLFSILKGIINQDIPFTKFFTWVLPPVYDLCNIYCINDSIHIKIIGGYFIWAAIYILLISFGYVKMIQIRGFGE